MPSEDSYLQIMFAFVWLTCTSNSHPNLCTFKNCHLPSPESFRSLLISNKSNPTHSNYRITSLQCHHLNWSHQHLLWRRQWHSTPLILPGTSHGRRSLVGCSLWGCEESRQDWATSLSLFTFMHSRRKWQPTPVFLPGESQGRVSLVYGVAQSDMTEAT